MDLASVIQTYLVDVKYRVDSKEMKKFQAALDSGASTVEKSLGSIQGTIAKFGALVVGTYAAIGYAVYKISTKVAESELNFQLLGMRMFMNTTAAKEMSIAMEALGHTMDEIAWNPELQRRFLEMIEVQERLRKNLGMSYQEDMLRMRDFNQQVNILQMTLKNYAIPAIVDKIFKSFAEGMGLTEKLKEFNKELQTKEGFDAFVNKWSGIIIPILHTIKDTIVDVGTAFTHFVGFLSDDKTLEEAPLSFETFAAAIGHVANGVKWLVTELDKFIHWMERHPTLSKFLIGGGIAAMIAIPLIGVFTTLATVIGGAIAALAALPEFLALISPFLAPILGALLGVGAAAALLGNVLVPSNKVNASTDVAVEPSGEKPKKTEQEKSFWNRFVDTVSAVGHGIPFWGIPPPVTPTSTPTPAASEAGTAPYVLGEPTLTPYAPEARPTGETKEEKRNREITETNQQREAAIRMHGKFTGASDSYRKSIENLIYAAAAKFQLPTALLFSIAKQEDPTLDPYAVSKVGAAGIGQFMPDTAAEVGIKDRFDPSQSIFGMAKYLRMMMDKFGQNVPDAIVAYNAGPGRVPAYEQTGELPDETRDYLRSVTARAGDLNVGGVTITITQPNATKEEIMAAVVEAFDKKLFKTRQRATVGVGGPFG
jgi:Transglycosylase SLT domain